MYADTIQLQECSFCAASCGPDAFKPYDIRIKDGDEVVKEGRYLACNECAEMIEAMGKRIAGKAREASDK
jgi:uncharacterized protein (DUF169 family)